MPRALHDSVAPSVMARLPYDASRAAIALRARTERDASARMSTWFGAMAPEEADALIAGRRARRQLDPFPFSSMGSPLKRILFFDQTSWLPDNLLERGDRMMMAAGIEGRMPFMDTKLAEVVSTFPDQIMLGAKGGKAVLRHAVRDRLPPEILNRRKVGFRVPVHQWFQTTLRDYLYDHLLGPDLHVRAMCDVDRLDEVFTEHASGRRNHEKSRGRFSTSKFFAGVQTVVQLRRILNWLTAAVRYSTRLKAKTWQ